MLHSSLLSPSEMQVDFYEWYSLSLRGLNQEPTPGTSIILKPSPNRCSIILKKKERAEHHHWSYKNSIKMEAVKGSDLVHHCISNT